MAWVMLNQQIARVKKRTRIWAGAFLCCLFLVLATPKIPLSPQRHLFADMRNFLGVPNTLNVFTNFPFLILGVMGFVLTLEGSFFHISFRGEVWGWALFYAGIVGEAFGSAYYHLKPDDNRVMWDTLPMMISYGSLLSSLLVERVGWKIGLSSLIALVSVAFLSMIYARTCNDFRLCMTFQLIPSIAIPAMAFLLPPKYTHSRCWFYATGVHLLAKFEAVADRKIYGTSHYIISGHALEHLCSAMVPVLLTVMLMCRNTRFERLGDCKESIHDK